MATSFPAFTISDPSIVDVAPGWYGSYTLNGGLSGRVIMKVPVQSGKLLYGCQLETDAYTALHMYNDAGVELTYSNGGTYNYVHTVTAAAMGSSSYFYIEVFTTNMTYINNGFGVGGSSSSNVTDFAWSLPVSSSPLVVPSSSTVFARAFTTEGMFDFGVTTYYWHYGSPLAIDIRFKIDSLPGVGNTVNIVKSRLSSTDAPTDWEITCQDYGNVGALRFVGPGGTYFIAWVYAGNSGHVIVNNSGIYFNDSRAHDGVPYPSTYVMPGAGGSGHLYFGGSSVGSPTFKGSITLNSLTVDEAALALSAAAGVSFPSLLSTATTALLEYGDYGWHYGRGLDISFDIKVSAIPNSEVMILKGKDPLNEGYWHVSGYASYGTTTYTLILHVFSATNVEKFQLRIATDIAFPQTDFLTVELFPLGAFVGGVWQSNGDTPVWLLSYKDGPDPGSGVGVSLIGGGFTGVVANTKVIRGSAFIFGLGELLYVDNPNMVNGLMYQLYWAEKGSSDYSAATISSALETYMVGIAGAHDSELSNIDKVVSAVRARIAAVVAAEAALVVALARPLDVVAAINREFGAWYGLPYRQIGGVINSKRSEWVTVPSIPLEVGSRGAVAVDFDLVLTATEAAAGGAMLTIHPNMYITDSNAAVYFDVYERDLTVPDGIQWFADDEPQYEQGTAEGCNRYNGYDSTISVFIPTSQHVYVLIYPNRGDHVTESLELRATLGPLKADIRRPDYSDYIAAVGVTKAARLALSSGMTSELMRAYVNAVGASSVARDLVISDLKSAVGYVGGAARIEGRVAAFDSPVVRPTRLYEANSGELVASCVSGADGDGAFSFLGVAPGEYMVVTSNLVGESPEVVARFVKV